MSDRLEYAGEPLPSGLPGFGGGTIYVLVLPGFNRVVAAQTFGPVNDAPTITPPDPQIPIGSNPEDPTNEVVNPGIAPVSQSGASSNFCKQCVPPEADNYPQPPLLFASAVESGCTDCYGGEIGSINWFDTVANDDGDGIFLKDGITGLKGKSGEDEWSITPTELLLDGSSGGVALNDSHLVLGYTRQQTYYQAGPEIIAPDGKRYTPKDIEVCISGSKRTWKILAAEA
jgi:hypothetical protein